MPAQRSEAADTIKSLLSRFPDAATKTLARKAYGQNPQLWTNLESCRTMVRNYRGNLGKQHRHDVADKSLFRPPTSSTNPFPKLPPAIKRLEPWESFRIDTPGDWLVLSDCHVPFHDEQAVKIALEKGREFKVKGVLLNGDIADFFRVSHHLKDPRTVDLWEEIEAVREFLQCVRDTFPKARIVYKEGNHEMRFSTFMLVKAPELLDLPEFKFESLMHLDKLKIEYVKDKRPILLGKLYVLHGHEYRQGISAPVNPARGLFLRAKVSALQGHCHRSSQHSEPDLSGHQVSCWSTGCLCQLDPEYDPINRWNHGMVIVTVGKQGEYEVRNYRIMHGKAWL